MSLFILDPVLERWSVTATMFAASVSSARSAAATAHCQRHGQFSLTLAPFLHRKFEILLLQLTDPDELTLPHAPLARFVDMESGESIEVEPAEIRGDYEKRMRARVAELAAASSARRIDFAAFDTASPYRDAIEAYLGFRRAGI